MNYIDLFIKPICLIILAEFSWFLFISLKSKKVGAKPSNIQKGLFNYHFKMLTEPSTSSKYINNLLTYIIPAFLLISSIFAAIMFPINSTSLYFNINNSIFFIYSIFLSFPATGIILALTSQHFSRIQATKELMSKVVQYYFALILCTIAIFITIYQNNHDSSLNFTFKEMIVFQQAKSISLFGMNLPALFVFLNPIGFIAYISAIVGLYRETNLDAAPKEMLRTWNVFEEFNGYKKGLMGMAQSIQFYLLIALMVPMYLAVFWGSEDFIIALLKIIITTIILIQILALTAESRPRILLDRKIKAFVRTPLLLSILSVIYALFLDYFIEIV